MTPIVSILIPSRGRFDRLLRAVRSALAGANTPDCLEVIIRLDGDDNASLGRLTELRQFGDLVRCVIGSRHRGYRSVDLFCQELNDAATGDWCWHMNDDMVIEGTGYDTQLSAMPTTGFLCQPQFHKLGPSCYENDARGPAPIYPRSTYMGGKKIGNPPDICIWQDAMALGWKVKFLPGIGVWHDWRK